MDQTENTSRQFLLAVARAFLKGTEPKDTGGEMSDFLLSNIRAAPARHGFAALVIKEQLEEQGIKNMPAQEADSGRMVTLVPAAAWLRQHPEREDLRRVYCPPPNQEQAAP